MENVFLAREDIRQWVPWTPKDSDFGLDFNGLFLIPTWLLSKEFYNSEDWKVFFKADTYVMRIAKRYANAELSCYNVPSFIVVDNKARTNQCWNLEVSVPINILDKDGVLSSNSIPSICKTLGLDYEDMSSYIYDSYGTAQQYIEEVRPSYDLNHFDAWTAHLIPRGLRKQLEET